MHKIMGHLDAVHLHALGQATKSLRNLCFDKLYFSKLSNENWENRGDADESIDVHDIQRLCGFIIKFHPPHLSYIRTLDLWLEDIVVEHCELLVMSLHHVVHLRLCCEQLCDRAVSCLASGFKLLHACHLVTCPLLTPNVFVSLQSLPALTILRLESCSGIRSHPQSPQILKRALPLMPSLRVLELNDSVSPSNTEAFQILSLSVCEAPQPLRIHCQPKSCIDEPMFQTDFHREQSPLGLVSFLCARCRQVQLKSERYITWFAESCCLSTREGCEFVVFAVPHRPHDDRAAPPAAVSLCSCLACSAGSGLDTLSVHLDHGYFQFGSCPPVAIPIRAESNHELERDLKGFSHMRRADGWYVPKTKSRQRQLWYACM